MNLNHLAIFHAVAAEGSISNGARRLMVSQPAVSKQIRILEKSLGLTLLFRHKQGVRLTAAGQVLAEHAAQLSAVERGAAQAMDELRGLRRGGVRMAASTTAGVHRLPGIMVRFRRKFPEIDLHLKISSAAEIEKQLLDFSIDVGITEGEIGSPLLEGRPLVEVEWVVIASPKDALARKRKVDLTLLCAQPFIVRDTGTSSESFAQRHLANLGYHPRAAMSLGSTEAIKHAVAAGLGVAIVSRIAVESEIKARTLVIVPMKDLSIRRMVRTWTARGRPQSPAAVAMMELLDQHKV